MLHAVKLNSGFTIPCVGLGTWLSKRNEIRNAVKIALKNGYRHIDCAHVYQNQNEIGGVLTEIFNEGQIKRDEIFITSKIWNTFHSHDLAKKSVKIIMNELRVSYIDLCLIHWPFGYEEGGSFFPKTADGKKMRPSTVDYLETWQALEECVKGGQIRSIGTSNFNHKQVQRLIDKGTIKPSVLQVEVHPYFQQKKLRKFCKTNNIVVTAYSPLGNPTMPMRKLGDASLLQEPILLKIAKSFGKSAAQVILRWHIQHGNVVIPKSVTEERIIENINVFDFELSSDEMSLIDGLNRNWRILDLSSTDGEHPLYPFKEEY